jgi:hypothetical protein
MKFASVACIVFLLASIAALAKTSFVTGECEEGSYDTWWKVIGTDGAGNTICITERNCYGEIYTSCPSDFEDPPGDYGGIVGNPLADPYFSEPTTGDTAWAVYEYAPGGLLGKVYKLHSTGEVHSTFDTVGISAPMPGFNDPNSQKSDEVRQNMKPLDSPAILRLRKE